MEESNPFSFIDVFAGIGGMRKAFEAVGGQCVFSCEWDKFAQKTYRANFDCDHEMAGDVTQVDVRDMPKHDLLLAGFPCQPFSISSVAKYNALGREHGFKHDTQGTLFFDLARIIEHHRPKAFLLENVPNLANHDQGRTFSTILRVLTEELGYHVSHRVLSAEFFVPQKRKRIFIVGFREPNGFTLGNLSLPANNVPRLGSILHPEDGSEEPNLPTPMKTAVSWRNTRFRIACGFSCKPVRKETLRNPVNSSLTIRYWIETMLPTH